jgi:hypothetical protein
MISKNLKILLLLAVVATLGACKIRPPVTADYDTEYNFSKLKSYYWIKPKDKNKVSTLDDKRQMKAIEVVLGRQGFNLASESRTADFLLKTHTVTDKKTDVDSYYRTWGHHPFPFYHPLGWPHNPMTTVVREYEVGTLVLDIIDPVNQQVIWRSSIARKLGIYLNRTPEERDTIALLNAQYLLEGFPPGRLTN